MSTFNTSSDNQFLYVLSEGIFSEVFSNAKTLQVLFHILSMLNVYQKEASDHLLSLYTFTFYNTLYIFICLLFLVKYHPHFLGGQPRVKVLTYFAQAQKAGSDFKFKYIWFQKSVILMLSTCNYFVKYKFMSNLSSFYSSGLKPGIAA